MTPAEFEAAIRAVGAERYHDKHIFRKKGEAHEKIFNGLFSSSRPRVGVSDPRAGDN
ncbi:hypothetical protein K9U39_20775 [Rhodoblastus acidophilus]|nr:hypothetical protein [Rhodoblastus acidophilus]